MKSGIIGLFGAVLIAGAIGLTTQTVSAQPGQAKKGAYTNKKLIQGDYHRDVKMIAKAKNLTPQQRKVERDWTRDRYLARKKANQTAVITHKKWLKTDNGTRKNWKAKRRPHNNGNGRG
jgi:hypothetical protein